jgi:hypothetical protein
MEPTIKVVYIGYNLDWNLTPDKSYDALQFSSQKYNLVNDGGVRYAYEKSLFKTLDEVREDKIKDILECED